MANSDKSVINFVAEVKKRTGVDLDVARVARGVPKRVPVNPDEDCVVRLAMDLLHVLRASDANSSPIAVIAAMQLVGNTLSHEFIRSIGQKQTEKAVAAAVAISSQYQPEFPDDKPPVPMDPTTKDVS